MVNEAETAVEDQLRSFGRGFTVLEQGACARQLAVGRQRGAEAAARAARQRRPPREPRPCASQRHQCSLCPPPPCLLPTTVPPRRPADLSNTLMADERVAVEKIKALSAEARREVEALEEEAREAARLIRRFEMEARMGPWVK